MSSTSRTILEDLTQSYLWMAGFKRTNETQKAQHYQELADTFTRSSSSSATVTTAATAAVATTTASSSSSSSSSSATFLLPSAETSHPSSSSSTDLLLSSPTSQLSQLESNVQKLQIAATQELAQATLRQVQRSVFKTPISDFGSHYSKTLTESD
jgi:hypothetical protein